MCIRDREKAFGYFCILCIIFRIHYSHTSLPFIYITPYLLQCLKHYLSYLFVIHIAWIELILVNWSRQESWGMHIGFCIDLWDGFKTRIVPLIRNQKYIKSFIESLSWDLGWVLSHEIDVRWNICPLIGVICFSEGIWLDTNARPQRPLLFFIQSSTS